jgi:hypothetical protein
VKNPTTLAVAAIVLVILPLFITLSVLAANLVIEATGTSYSVFGPPASTQLVIGAWSVVALALVGGLVFSVFRDQLRHA